MNLTATVYAFAMCFVAGPVLFLAGLRLPGGRGTAVALAAGCAGLCGLALSLHRDGGQALGLPATLTALTLLWAGWIVALVLLARAVRVRLSDPAMRRGAVAICLMATALPWFGLATARLIAA